MIAWQGRGAYDASRMTDAEALKVLGFVERFGVGLSIANKRLAANGNPPLEYDVQSSYVCVRLRRGSP